MNPVSTPRKLSLQWTALLLAPVSWTVALGALFSLTDEACVRHSQRFHWVVIATCFVIAVACLPLAWRELSTQADPAKEASGAVDRARFMLQVALGLGALFTLVLLLSAVPIALLSPCRT